MSAEDINYTNSLSDVEDLEETPVGRIVGPFSRMAKGGIIIGEDLEVFVPEIWVRRLGIEHGDWVAADPLGVLNYNMLYQFTVMERRNQKNNSKRQEVIGSLLFHAGDWIVYDAAEETTIYLNPREVKSLRLKEGDLVEIAYMQGEVDKARIAWVYEEQTLEQLKSNKAKQKNQRLKYLIDVADPILTDRKVFVVGADLFKDSFQRMFERRGAIFSWESGFQGGTGRNIESKVRNADIIVIVTEMMSHRLPDVELMCKRHNKPFVYAPSKGSTGAIREVQQKLQSNLTKRHSD